MLSKSRYTAGLQCTLRLHNQVHHPETATAPDDRARSGFETGNRVGQLAQYRYGDGVLIDTLNVRQAVRRTQTAMADKTTPAIYEAAFVHDSVLVRVDVLSRAPDGQWDLVEVKATARPKPAHLDDAAIQLWVLGGTGVAVRRAGVLTLNRDYVYRGGEHDLQQLFAFHDKTSELRAMLHEVGRTVPKLRAMLLNDAAPVVDMGAHCTSPYPCPFIAKCSAGLELPVHPVTLLPGVGPKTAASWAQKGIGELEDIPDGWPLNAAQRRALDATLQGRGWRSPELPVAIREPVYPISYLDFETTMPAIPRIVGTRPFEQLPTQWSNHIEHADGSVRHDEFIVRTNTDPRRPLAEALLSSVGQTGSICIYTSFEMRVIRDLAKVLPDLADPLLALLPRCWDLKKVIERHVMEPAFEGSYSLKRVVPALLGPGRYEALEIGDGLAAARAYERAMALEEGQERAAIFTELLAYCAVDTLVMVEIRRVLMLGA
ncbi:MAG: DUF2779 domain-containing protein [Myxococcales bacterium]|nr:DUF2779 domain-containing protein [Myxococcales bacterium]